MAKLSKRIKGFLESIDQSKVYNMQEAFKIIKENSKVKFNESVDVSINLGIDAKKSDQNVRGSLVLPNGTGKSVKVAVFCEGDEAKAAKENGADVIGMEDLAENIKKGEINFDILMTLSPSVITLLYFFLRKKRLPEYVPWKVVTKGILSCLIILLKQKAGHLLLRCTISGLTSLIIFLIFLFTLK